MNKIIYLGHASFLFKNDSFEAVIDPYKDGSVPNLTFPKGLVVDAVFCSHEHADHNASELVKIKDNPAAIKSIETVVPHDHFGGSKRGLNKIRMFDFILRPVFCISSITINGFFKCNNPRPFCGFR